MAKFDVKALQKESVKQQQKQKNQKGHSKTEIYIDVEKSYDQSMALLDKKSKTYDQSVEHLESVLSAGPVRSES